MTQEDNDDRARDGGSDLADRLEEVQAAVGKLTANHRSLAATVRRRLVTGQSPDSGAVEQLDAEALPEGEELVAWVRWLTERYQQVGAILPACWPKHGQLVEELDALRVGWRDTIGAGEGGMAAMQWHDLFGRALERIEYRWRVCSDGTHREGVPADWLAGGPLGGDDIDLERDRFPTGAYSSGPRSGPGGSGGGGSGPGPGSSLSR